jgi:hypothetical protein
MKVLKGMDEKQIFKMAAIFRDRYIKTQKNQQPGSSNNLKPYLNKL